MNLKKKDLSATDYFRQMKNLVDTQSAIGTLLRQDEVVSYILVGLGSEHDALSRPS